ncbi:hypothetical protein [Candidatus Sulfurimonas baltica]|uniref:Uncharacterized protein n=1 Tax=Candidatus Sulfurimonas baltica TaxID=2740404 RepID=A0A7S7LWT5_9BACT|nr:hypothetical protein [Candidatus Sulfurimonas baltica]QOY52921.1 hypothetical protein HUE88_04335 [Candidatus Sulfurimonas baltica]
MKIEEIFTKAEKLFGMEDSEKKKSRKKARKLLSAIKEKILSIKEKIKESDEKEKKKGMKKKLYMLGKMREDIIKAYKDTK